MAESHHLRILLFLGSTREGRMGERVAKYLENKLVDLGYSVDVADPLTMEIPMLVQPLQYIKDPSKVPPFLTDLNERVKAADVYLVVTSEYNRQIPPALTNIIDHCPPASYANKTSAIVAYSLGPAGGVVAAMQCRTLMTELGAPPIPFTFSVAAVNKVFSESGEPLTEEADGKFEKMVMQIQWYGEAMKKQRKSVGTDLPAYWAQVRQNVKIGTVKQLTQKYSNGK